MRDFRPKPRLQRDLQRLTRGIAALRIVYNLIQRTPMTGEIRDAMAKLRAAKEGMVADMLKEIGDVQSEVEATRTDGMDAMKLPRAELEKTKEEIREIRAEFAPTTNAPPLPDHDLAEKKI